MRTVGVFEAVLNAKKRNEIPDELFGLPKERKYPLNDGAHVRKAIQFFKYCESHKRNELATNINKRIKELKMDITVSEDNPFYKYANKSLIQEESYSNYADVIGNTENDQSVQNHDNLGFNLGIERIDEYILGPNIKTYGDLMEFENKLLVQTEIVFSRLKSPYLPMVEENPYVCILLAIRTRIESMYQIAGIESGYDVYYEIIDNLFSHLGYQICGNELSIDEFNHKMNQIYNVCTSSLCSDTKYTILSMLSVKYKICMFLKHKFINAGLNSATAYGRFIEIIDTNIAKLFKILKNQHEMESPKPMGLDESIVGNPEYFKYMPNYFESIRENLTEGLLTDIDKLTYKHKPFIKPDFNNIDSVTEGITINEKGDIKISLSPKKSYMDEYAENHRILDMNYKNKNFEAMKPNIAFAFMMISVIERDPKYKSKDKDLVNARKFFMNDFKTYLRYLQKEDKDFDFAKYYTEMEYDKIILNIPKSTIVGIKQLVKAILK